jgi:TatD DNase family protein
VIVDTHCHLDNDSYNSDLLEVLQEAKDHGITHMIIPGADPSTLKKAQKISQEHQNIYFTAGVHPYDIDKFNIKKLKEYLLDPRCIAIGECGLDYFRLPENESEKEVEKKRQKEIFIKHIELANEYKKPLIIHIRESSSDAKDILLKYSNKISGGVLHCYNANRSLLELSEYNFYFGIGGVVTFKNAKKLVNIIKDIPRDKILLETDSPYLTPHPHRGQRNKPSYTKLVLEKLSDILNTPQEILEDEILNNTKRLFTTIKN